MKVMILNKNREQIINLIENAQTSVQIAVSWLTDEAIIEKLAVAAQHKQVQILLSCDTLNVWRYSELLDLQRKGAQILKTGSIAPGTGGFMHAKFIIIDGKLVFGGSFNFTDGASYNYENFKRYADYEVPALMIDFKTWWASAMDYKFGFENPDAVKKLVIQNFETQEQFRQNLLSQYDTEQKKVLMSLAEREAIIKAELEKDKLRENALALKLGSSTIDNSGKVKYGPDGTSSKPHRFYGGSLKAKFGGKKLKNSYYYALIQKHNIERNFSFLRCHIKNDTLICRGEFLIDGCNAYDIRIEFRAGACPQVFILNPQIESTAEIHIYREGSLCLYFPGDLQWKPVTNIAEYTIPWIYEWILYYELYIKTSKWEGDYVPHGGIRYEAC